jgi:hypothetical protein
VRSRPNWWLMGSVLIAALASRAPAEAQTFDSDGATHDASRQSGWAVPGRNGSTTNYNNCLRCHQPAGFGSDRTDYLFGGHKNMSRAADGVRWGMPGVDATHPASPGLSGASLNPDGSFSALAIQDGSPRMAVDWLHGVGNAPSLVSVSYCAKDATGAIGADDAADLAACPACASPVVANGNAGYPLNYPDAASCAAAATHTGKPYTWFTPGSEPVYWIAGGAGLEGSPAVFQRGSQPYACGRCHTTGWTANRATDVVITSQSRQPYIGFPGAGLAGSTVLGGGASLLGPGFEASAYAALSGSGVGSVTLTSKGLYPTSAPPPVAFSGGGGSGAAAHAVMAADPYGSYLVSGVVMDAPGSGYASAPSVSIGATYALSSWDQWGIQCSRCHTAARGGAHAKSVATDFPAGGDTVSLCMGCHRQEGATGPRSIQGGNGFAGNSGLVLPYTNTQQQPAGFGRYAETAEFLNSPHARFTGDFRDVGCPPYAILGYAGVDPGNPGAPAAGACTPGTMNLDGATASRYASKFAQASQVDLTGVSRSAAGSCTTCHDMHEPLAENTAGMSASVKNRCTFCHSNPASGVSPQVFLGAILHPSGTATPLGDANADPSAACVSCHMPPGMTHLLRISTDPSYTTFGDMSYGYPVSGPKATSIGSGAWAGNAPGLVNLPRTTPDGVYANAVWADLDHACGQCHGGGVSSTDLVTTGSITAGSTNGTSINPFTVADVTGFAAGKTVTIAGAGWAGAPFKTIVAKVVPDAFPAVSGTVYLTYPAVTSVNGAAVTVAGNPPKPTASWFSRAQLAAYAKGMHPFNAAVLFTAAYGANGLTINVDASASSCDGSVANCSAFDWDWGDSSAHGSGVAATHVYSPTGSSQDYTITLTVTQRGYVVGSATRKITAYNTDNPPVASGACAMDYTTWTIGCTNTSTDDKGIQSASINWGDGTVVSNVTGLGTGPFPHTFLLAGNYSIALTVVDTAGQQKSATIGSTVAGSFNTYSIAGKVFRKGGVLPLAAAQVQVKRGTVVVVNVFSAADGSYTTVAMKPGTYTLTATKSGYTFASPTATVTTPPAATTANLVATGP